MPRSLGHLDIQLESEASFAMVESSPFYGSL